MSDITIGTVSDERAFIEYQNERNKPRTTMANGVYPNCKVALANYQKLVDRLETDMIGFQTYHANVTEPVANHVANLQAAMQTIVTIMEAIETAAPGTFGISLPAAEVVNE